MIPHRKPWWNGRALPRAFYWAIAGLFGMVLVVAIVASAYVLVLAGAAKMVGAQ